MAAAGRWVVIDRPNLSPSDDEDNETVSEGEDKNTSFSSITNPNKCFSVAEVLVKEEKEESEEDECSILAFNPFDSLTADFNRSHESELGAEEEVVVLAERGKVACKDYPHSRHHCAEYPFERTPHERFCANCYCYVCDEVAPCLYWEENSSGHCHASDKEEKWKDLRLSTRNSLQNREQNLPTQANCS